jgi:flagellar protein FlaG
MEINTNISVISPIADKTGVSTVDAGKGQNAPVQRLVATPHTTGSGSSEVSEPVMDPSAASIKEKAVHNAALKAAMDAGTQSLKQVSPALEFQIDPDTKQTVVRVVDTTNNEVIKQIPSAEFLRISSAIEGLQKNLLDEKA